MLGRKTYEGFAAAWPQMTGTGEFGEKMNRMPKYVVSSTLDKVEWTGSKLVKGDVTAQVRQLKKAPGHDLLLSGSAQLFNALMAADLIDLYRFMVHPVVLGKGKCLFADGVDKKLLALAECKSFAGGIVVLEYRPASR